MPEVTARKMVISKLVRPKFAPVANDTQRSLTRARWVALEWKPQKIWAPSAASDRFSACALPRFADRNGTRTRSSTISQCLADVKAASRTIGSRLRSPLATRLRRSAILLLQAQHRRMLLFSHVQTSNSPACSRLASPGHCFCSFRKLTSDPLMWQGFWHVHMLGKMQAGPVGAR